MITFLTSRVIWPFINWVLILILTTYFVVNYLVYQRRIKRWEESNIPFVRPTFLIGHKYFLSATKYNLSIPLDKIYKENSEKDVFGFFMGTIPVVIVKDQKMIRQISSKNFSQLTNVLAVPESEVEAQHMINLTVNDETWKFTLSQLAPIFSMNWFQGPRFEGITEAIHELCRITETFESEGAPVNVKGVTLNAIIRIGSSNLGIESNSQTMKDGLRTIIDDFFEPSYRRMMIFHFLSYLPSLHYFEYFKVVPRKICNIMSDILENLMKKREQADDKPGDFLDLLRSIKAKQEEKISYINNSDLLTIKNDVIKRQLTGMSLAYILAGSETVNELLVFAIHSLSLHPEYQHKIRKEVHETLKKHGVSEFNFDVVRSLMFTFQCLLETNRLFPAGPLMMRQCIDDFQIPGTNYILRKGDKVAVPLYSLARDENQFRDPLSFNPDRFIFEDMAGFVLPENFLNFGIGLRRCPGYKHGLLVAAALLALIVYKYEIKPRSHLKLADATDYNPKGMHTSLRKDLIVDLVRYGNIDDT